MRICEDIWRQRLSSFRRQEVVAFSGDALVFGCGTVLMKAAEDAAPPALNLRPETAHDRIVALLVVAERGHLAKAALLQLGAALDEWRRGDRALAAMRLAFARLPRVRDLDEAHTLFLAETALDAGLSANDLLKELGYSDGLPLLKFDPNQPRVPAGSGARSGQWTSDAPSVSFAPGIDPTSFEAFPDRDVKLKPTPVLLPPEGGDAEVKGVEDKARQLLDDTVEERIKEGHPLPKEVPGGFEIAPAAEMSGVGEADPGVPKPGTSQAPQLKPAGGGGGSSTDDPSRPSNILLLAECSRCQ